MLYTSRMPDSTPKPASSMEAKMDEILVVLHRMDTRDKWRNVGGFFRGLIALIPMVIIVVSTWYFYVHGADFMKLIADQAASSAAEYTQGQGSGLVDELMKKYAVPPQQ